MYLLDDPLAIPLWINGHAYLTMAEGFLDVRNPINGQVLRRIPLCGANEVQRAVEAAQAAHDHWTTQTTAARAVLLAAVGDALAGYADHFVRLIVEESGMDGGAAKVEVAAAVTLLHEAVVGDVSGVVGVVGGAATPLLGALRLAVPPLMAGSVVVIRPHPESPSALFALAELTGRCGFPGGVFNILHGEASVIDGLRAQAGVHMLYS